MWSRIAKVLFPLSLLIFMVLAVIDVNTTGIGFLRILPPPYAGISLIGLLLANVIYLLTFATRPLMLRVLLAVTAPFLVLSGSFGLSGTFFCADPIRFLVCGLVALVFGVVLYLRIYDGL